MIPKVDKDICVGVGNCVAIAPEVFAFDDENKAYVFNPNGADEDTIRKAAESCPVDAITLEDEVTGETLYP
jgi:ferredoxin